MKLIEAGCEAAVAALKGWLTELQALRFDNIDKYLADDLVVTCASGLREIDDRSQCFSHHIFGQTQA